MPCVSNWLSRITSGNGNSSERGTILETVPRGSQRWYVNVLVGYREHGAKY